jgi:hypothetical protein
LSDKISPKDSEQASQKTNKTTLFGNRLGELYFMMTVMVKTQVDRQSVLKNHLKIFFCIKVSGKETTFKTTSFN